MQVSSVIIRFIHTHTTEPASLSTGTISVKHPVEQCSIQKMKGKFSKLVAESCRRIQRSKINIKYFQLFIVAMCSCDPKGDDVVATKVESAKDLDEIFRILSKSGFWDYLNYYPLQSVIEHFASNDNELRDMMEQYKKDLSGHNLVSHGSSHQPGELCHTNGTNNIQHASVRSDSQDKGTVDLTTNAPSTGNRALITEV